MLNSQPWDLDAVTTLTEFMSAVTELEDAEREEIVDQAIVLLRDLYVHLQHKQNIYGVNPLHRLDKLRRRLETKPSMTGEPPRLTDAQFHREMIATFAALRDLHTAYVLPKQFHRWVAFLPFTVEAYTEADREHYIVTHVQQGHAGEGFEPGAEVVHWCGVPIARAVELQSDRSAGATEAARRAKGLARLTCRYLALEYRPDEDWVNVGFLVDAAEHERRFAWQVGRLPAPPAPEACGERGSEAAFRTGLDLGAEMHRRTRTALFTAQSGPAGRSALLSRPAGAEPAESATVPEALAGLLAYQSVQERYGLLRIYSFATRDREAFVTAVRKILESAPPAGLIIDVRNNPGGDVTIGEYLLQLLTGREIEPARFAFRASPLAEALAKQDQLGFKPWLDHFVVAEQTGDQLTAAESLESRPAYNRIGQYYQGPVLLIVDALSYSTTDMFAAGFQDHRIGKILGTSARTGAGGATVADHHCLAAALPTTIEGIGPNPLRPLRSGASFSIALRRSVRIGEHAGTPVEDFGVEPDDKPHQLTPDDLLHHNRDLIDAAIKLLDEQRESRPSLSVREEGLDWIFLARHVDTIRVTQVAAFGSKETVLGPDYPYYVDGYPDYDERGENRWPRDRLGTGRADVEWRVFGYKHGTRVVSTRYDPPTT